MHLKLILLLFVFSPQLVSASFVCGVVDDSPNHSASWLDVITYYSLNPSDLSRCKVSPENKFCCDLEEISSTKWEPGKKVSAEVLDNPTTLIAGPVELTLTEEGYDIFPEMLLQEAIIVQPYNKVLIKEDKIVLNITLNERYSNLKYEISNNNMSELIDVCTDCENISLEINLSKGTNEIELIAYNSLRQISKILKIYSLDYLEIYRTAECNGCTMDEDSLILPLGQRVNITLILNSSHDISGKLLEYIPIGWPTNLEDKIEEYSDTHRRLSFDIQGKFTKIDYIIAVPRMFFPRTFEFISEFEGYRTSQMIRVSPFSWWPKLFHLKEPLNENSYYEEDSTNFKISQNSPLILKSYDSEVELIAIYPKKETDNAHARLIYERKGFIKKEIDSYHIKTNLADEDIEKVLIQYRLPKETFPAPIQEENSLDYKKYDSDEEFDYYETYLPKKSSFKLH